MGLFDAVKSFKNAITGGAAKVFVDVADASVSQPFDVVIRAVPQGCNVSYSRVYLRIKGEETVEVPDVDISFTHEGKTQTRREIVRKDAVTLSIELTVAGAGELTDGKTGEWRISVKLPEGSIPEFRGKFAKHGYSLYAGLDCKGNDPDSGWVAIKVKP
jgi:hypothetical protein